MFIAHLPAGYILTKKIQQKAKVYRYLAVGLFASILPDIDLLYFYLIDQRQTMHHYYWTHIPFYWLIIAIFCFLIIRVFGRREQYILTLIFFSNIFLHLFLDTIVGHIEWLYPFVDKTYSLFEVPAIHEFWIYNFFFHWSFLFEILIIIWALFYFFRFRKIKP